MMDIRENTIEDNRKLFIEQIIVDNIQRVAEEGEQDPIEAMKSLGFGILEDLDGCCEREIYFHITPFQVTNNSDDECPVIVHPQDTISGVIEYLDKNDIANGGEAMHNMYYYILEERGLHSFSDND